MSPSEAANVIEILTQTLNAICDTEVDNSYEVKQKLINKISELIDKL
jgi:DNA-binding XRE family transcriptional regulator